jgi:hypothetical protein
MLPAVVTVMVLAAACGGDAGSGVPTSPTGGPQPGFSVELTLAPGQRAPVGTSGLSLLFTGVARDSRCPANAFCVTVGEAVAVFEATQPNQPAARLELETPEGNRTAVVSGYRVDLTSLQPYPFGAEPIEPQAYRATVRVTANN